MACCNSSDNCSNSQYQGGSNINYVIILVLYILLAIILGSAIWY